MRFRLGPVRFDAVSMEYAVTCAVRAISDGRQIRLAFANPEIVVEAARNARLAGYLNDCELVLADGTGILIANRAIRGVKRLWRVTGTDFVPAICEAAVREGFSIFLLGGRPGVAEDAASNLQRRMPGLRIAGCRHGYFDFGDESAIVEEINVSGAQVLMVCLGNPKQEEWIERNFRALRSAVVFGNGGALDFYSGRVLRAPICVQRLGFEWLFRLIQDPSLTRVRRQARLLEFLWMVLVWTIGGKSSGSSANSSPPRPPSAKGPV